jgi:hypothetical protein
MMRTRREVKKELDSRIATVQVLWATREEQGGRAKAKLVRDNKRRYLSGAGIQKIQAKEKRRKKGKRREQMSLLYTYVPTLHSHTLPAKEISRTFQNLPP